MDNQSDGFKWFGEGFDGFPKILPDDCVQYQIYIIDARLTDFALREQLRKIQAAANALCKALLKDFIWQRQGFGLDLIQQRGRSFLQGRTNFGDSVEDEWLIVYLLRELSKQYPQSWIRVFDSDGEFLLIEAADALPRWLNPEVAENRVWINNEKLHIVPKSQSKQKARAEALTLENALMFIQDRASDLVQEPSIDSEAFFRLQKYPAQIRSSVHHATVTIPRRLAYILHQDPAYISPAVEAFYLRDPIALRPLQTRRSSTLFFIPEDFVTVTVRFSRVGYAQLKGQDFPKPPAWVGGSAKGIGTHGPTQREMGMKVTCGFEMLLSDPQNVDKKSVREIKLLLEDVDAREEQLPSDDDIARWESIQDDESWLEIDFNDFETELSGRGGQIPLRQGAGFGDRTAQDNLRKMVARFEKFLHDEDETGEDAEFLDDMDYDDDSDTADGTTTPNSKSKDGESEVDFDEGRFASMIRDMMGIAPSTTPDTASNRGMPADRGAIVEEDDESLEESEMRRVMDEMETELTQAGALSLEPSSIDKSYSKKDSASSRIPSSGVPIKSTPSQSSKMSATEDFAEDGGEVSIDPDPAKELLRHLTKG